MPYNTKTLKRDQQGIPAPQYFNTYTDDYEPVLGTDGGLNVTTMKRRFREDFPGSALGSKWSIVQQGSGHTISVANSALSISTGTTPNTETILLLNEPFTVPSKVFFIVYLSQRIANQEFYLEVVDASGQHVAGVLFDGTSATTAKRFTTNNGTTNGPTTWTTLSSSSYSAYEIELYTDEVIIANRATDSQNIRSYQTVHTRLIPDPNLTYYVRLRAKNLSTAPASSTTLYVDAIVVQDVQELLAEISGGNGSAALNQSLPVYVLNGLTTYGYNRLVFNTDSTSPLGANATFTGSSRDTTASGIGQYKAFRTMVFADQPGTLYIEQSRDNTTWRVIKQVSVSANTVVTDETPIYLRYVRVRYVNGATAQTAFELNTALVGI